ncbi:mucin-5AC [Tenrec ecaudatus]|uniref:mucin-5AC n=1 Tax=Tenrec ecaudatus TaxID=94439 RepID=UPI003F5914DE
MAVGRRRLVPLWTLALALACTHHTGQAQQGPSESSYEYYPDLPPLEPGPGGNPLGGVTIFPPLKTTVTSKRALNPAHNGRVCSTWGDFHYKTFDGDIFRFPGLCNYVLASHCRAPYEDFNVQLRRGPGANGTTPSRVVLKLDGMVLELTESSVLVNGHPVQLPFSQAGVLIERNSMYLKVRARLGLVFLWNPDNSLLLELDDKYANQTCGLCGDFNGLPVFSEFLSNNIKLTPTEYGNLQKMDGPTEQCQDPAPTPLRNCTSGLEFCQETLLSQPFSACHALVDPGSYIEACQQDICLCTHDDPTSCACPTLAEYARQCVHAGGVPQDWRTSNLCPAQTCPFNMEHQECGLPCPNTCSNLEHAQLCEDHCVSGCFCPQGTVFDDISQNGCVPVSQCSCTYNGIPYPPGAVYSTDCTSCTCSGGRWSCQESPCPGTCSVLGGSHVSTFDEKQYTVHGDCSYVLAKPCDGGAFTVLAELRKCGLTDSETCLKSVTLSLGGGQTVVVVKASGEVFVNQIYTQLPVSAANLTLFRPSTFFVIAQTALGLQLDVQLVPTMQVFLRLAPALRGLTCGLCGNFNSIQADDFQTISGVVEGTAAAFANTWKTQAACPNVKNTFEDPCSLSVENEKYAQYWCSRLTDPKGRFAQCHATVNPATYYSNCMFDTCNCEKSEACLCSALSAYVRACAAKGVLLSGWREGACAKSMTTCPKSLNYSDHVSTCQPTCRSLSEEDPTCHISFVPVDGCVCTKGTYLDDSGKCVPAASCPCYHQGVTVPSGESVHEGGAVCTCTHGKLTCIGIQAPTPACAAPMVYFDCRNATPGASGAGCQKSCHTLDMACYSSQCVSGCVCPNGLVADGEGGCIAAEDCPCVHNEASYKAGQTIHVGCNTCTCKNRMWQCTQEPCLATCAVYGDGHYLTFDGQRFSFDGDCEYTLVQDHCSSNSSVQGSFRVVTENVPCGTTGTTCSKAIKIFLGSYELKLSDGNVEVIEKGAGQGLPYFIRQMGIYLVVDTDVGLVLQWDKKTSLFLRLSPEFKGKVCGLCGNFDGNAINDFTTRSQSVVGDVLEFGNSWKFSPTCPDALAPRDPCIANPYRKAWAQKQCSILHSATFAACHAHVEPTKYYEACVSDACACDSGGDCECFCTAVAAYAQACHDAGVCVSWRSPEVCPLFCDYYNPQGECEWHYQPCGAPCMRTCRNPSGRCLHDLRGLEGCYPKCPPEAPIFDEEEMQCVAQCSTPPPPPPCRVRGKDYRPGVAVPSDQNCQTCACTEHGVVCVYNAEACVCTYDGQHFRPGDIIYHTSDGTGSCISARCVTNGTIERTVQACGTSTVPPTTTFSFSTPSLLFLSPTLGSHTPPVVIPVTNWTFSTPPGSSPPPTHMGCRELCTWTPWLDASHPGRGIDSGDFDTLQNLRDHGFRICRAPKEVQCRAEARPHVPLAELGQHVECSRAVGLTCYNRAQASGLCDNYQIRVQCCSPEDCPLPPSTAAPPGPAQTTATPTPVPGTWASSTMRTTTSRPTTQTQTATSSPAVPSSVSCMHMKCSWSEWIDGSYPKPGRDGGDFDTFQNLRSKGYDICQQPAEVQCRAERYPDTPLALLGQVVTCSNTTGLLCLNKDQLPPICLNYEIRVRCCHPVNECMNVTTAPVPTATSASTPPTTLVPQSRTMCTWTKWFDVDFPSSGLQGGDVETYDNIVRHGEKVCHKPEAITQLQCRAENHPEVSIERLGQVVECNPDVGLVCRNQDQMGKFPMCFNYEIRVLCLCTWTKWFDVDFPSSGLQGGDVETYDNIIRHGEKVCHKPEAITQLQCRAENHPEVSIERLGQVVECNPDVGLVCRNQDQMGKFPMCFNYEIRVLCLCTWTKWFDVDFPSSGLQGGDVETYDNIVRHGEKVCHKPEAITQLQCRAKNHPEVSIERLGQVVECNPDVGLVCRNQDQMGKFPMCFNYEIRVLCLCTWTKWFDVDFPSSGLQGGDVETYDNIVRHGEKVCHKPEAITQLQCRAENHPEVSIERLGQVVECNPDVGLVCRNQDQMGKFPMCFNYEIRVLWTKWFDVDFPSSGLQGGDVETYDNIVRHGEKVCHKPEAITQLQCRAKNHPEVSIERLGQVVECNPDVGLVCRNQDQMGKFPMCFNYEIRVLCCTSTVPPATSPVSTTTTTPIPPTTTPVSTTTTTPIPPTTSIVPPGTPTVPPATTTTPIPPTTPPVPTTTTTTTTPIPPATSTVPPATSPVPETTHSPCPTVCTWTKWFDVDFPSSGLQGGDVETYDNIVRHGEKVCHKPEAITQLQCRAENHPEVSIERLGQVVECNPDVGLVCRNQDQMGKFPMCFNYEIRVLCCEPQDCPPTSVTPSVPAPSTPQTPHTSPPVTILSSTTQCYCAVAGKFYPAGATIYQQRDLDGHCYSAQCTQDCHVVKNASQDCPPTTPPPTPPPSPSPSANHMCSNVVPPRKKGETWNMPGCTQATCEGHDVITLHPRTCPPSKALTCANGYPPMTVMDKDGCCPHQECQCVCSGWGDPHYITFDGTYYTFLDNCTYVLVQQIVPRYGHFRVLIDNYFCNAEDGLSCPRSIILEYQQDRVVLTRRPGAVGISANQILFNGKQVQPGFRSNGIVVSQLGIKMFVSVPAIGLQVMFTGLIFSVEVPVSKFDGNTEGQCGTCSNNQKDDCRLPDGALDSSCSRMAGHWKVTTPNQPFCLRPPSTPMPTTTPSTWNRCKPSLICQLILSKVFEHCHDVIPPRPYYEGCVFDQCHVDDVSVMCSSLEMYASLCASHGRCIDWRGYTNNTCAFTCPPDQVYEPCGPISPTYCYGNNSASINALQDFQSSTEGCFCPAGLTLFSESIAVCVPTDCPSCQGPNGEPVEPGQTIVANCQECTCDGSTRTLSCRAQTCPAPPSCHAAGHVAVPVPMQEGQCCTEYHCVCNSSSCPQLLPCPQGSHAVITHEEGQCCPSRTCSEFFDPVCVYNGSIYQPGAVVSSSLCKTCRCQAPQDPATEPYMVICETQICKRLCQPGFEYRELAGQCCGTCVPVACVIHTRNGSVHLFYVSGRCPRYRERGAGGTLGEEGGGKETEVGRALMGQGLLQPNETWTDPEKPCETHECERHPSGPAVVTTKKACPVLDCPQEQAQLGEDGCCLQCPHPPSPGSSPLVSTCAVYYKQEVIQERGCRSLQPLHLPYCKGNCGDTASIYSFKANKMEHRCQCCRELRTSLRNVTLSCGDGSTRAFSYRHVEQCGCVGPRCDSEDSQEDSQEAWASSLQ